jgi:plastocyanin
MQFPLYAVCLAAAFLFERGALAQATIEGKVELPQSSAEQLTTQRYQNSAEAQTGPPDPPMAVVYLEGSFANVASPPRTAEMAQKNINFAPNLLPIRVGTTVTFPNLDDTYHNVFSYSKTKRFDLGRYRKDEKPESVLFDKPGVVTLHCEVHGTMRGTILVLDTPFFQKTSLNGGYRLRDVPAGHYTLKAWLSENDLRSREVDLKPGTTLRVDFPAK